MPTYSEAVLATNPAHYWPFEETSGTTATDSIGGSDGSYQSANISLSRENLIQTQSRNPWGDGSGNNVEFTASAVDPVSTTSPFTIAGWLRINNPDDTSYHSLYARRGPSNNHGVILFWSNDSDPEGYISLTLGNGTTATNLNNFDLGQAPVNTRLFVVGRYDGTNLKLNVNDQSTITTAMSGTPSAGNDALGTVSGIEGNFGHLAIWNRAITDAEISSLYELGSQPTTTTERPGVANLPFRALGWWRPEEFTAKVNEPHLPVEIGPVSVPPFSGNFRDYIMAEFEPIRYWRFGESSGTTAVDETGNANGAYVDSLQYTLGVTGGVTGSSDTAVTFSGNSNGHVTTGGTTIPAGSVRTIAVLLKRVDATTYDPIFGSYTATLTLSFFGGDGGLDMYNIAGGVTAGYSPGEVTTDFTDGNWHSLVFLIDQPGNLVNLWTDGVDRGSKSMTDEGSATAFRIGNDDAGGEYFKGSMDEFIYCDYAWTQADVTKFSNAVNNGVVSYPIAPPETQHVRQAVNRSAVI